MRISHLAVALMIVAMPVHAARAEGSLDGLTSPPAAVQDSDAPEQKLIDQGAAFLRDGHPGQAIPLFDQVIDDDQKAHAGEKRQIYCSRSLVETLLYASMAAKDKKDSVILGSTWATAIFLKGFALVDANRSEEAKPLFEQAIALSPMNAQFLSELGEWYRTHGDAQTAFAKFQQASDAAEFSPKDAQSTEKRRALRGMAFVLTDEGKLDDAEALYRQCLKLDPTDAHAKSELEYIRQQRKKLAGTS